MPDLSHQLQAESQPIYRMKSRRLTEQNSAILPNEFPPFYRTNSRHFTERISAILPNESLPFNRKAVK